MKQKMCSNCETNGCTVIVYVGELVCCPRKTTFREQKKQEKSLETPEIIKSFRGQKQ